MGRPQRLRPGHRPGAWRGEMGGSEDVQAVQGKRAAISVCTLHIVQLTRAGNDKSENPIFCLPLALPCNQPGQFFSFTTIRSRASMADRIGLMTGSVTP